MESKNYKIKNLCFTQSQLNWEQDKKLITLFNRLRKKAAPNDEFQIEKTFELIEKYDLLAIALGIIIKPVWNWRYLLYITWQVVKFPFLLRFYWVPAGDLNHSQIEEIRKDFFFINKSVLSKLSTFVEGLGLIGMEAMKD